VASVTLAHTGANPGAVVVVELNAHSTITAVEGPGRLDYLAGSTHAQRLGIYLVTPFFFLVLG